MKDRGKTVVISINEKLPPVGARVMVVTDKFRCLGYLDEKGVWRHDRDAQPIEGVIGWHQFLAN